MQLYYDRQGQPIDEITWLYCLSDPEYKRIALDRAGDYTISTVWLGIDHAFGRGEPLIFETMVSHADEDYTTRYRTEDEAMRGHAEVLELLRSVPGALY